VQLVTDPNMRINVRVEPAGTTGLLVGSLTGDITLEQVPLDANVQPGDVVLTSGLGGNYVPNLLVGQVTGVRKLEFELFQSASVQPVVDFNRLNIVLVITNFQPIDYAPLIPTPIPPQ
ncbi:MAG: rod shape-determining protein MreC, partial [Anaerolineae bacterium]